MKNKSSSSIHSRCHRLTSFFLLLFSLGLHMTEYEIHQIIIYESFIRFGEIYGSTAIMSLPLHIDEPYERWGNQRPQKNCWQCREIIIKYDLVKYLPASRQLPNMRAELMRTAVINETKWKRRKKNAKNDGVKVSRLTPIGNEQLFLSSRARCYRLPKQTCCQ